MEWPLQDAKNHFSKVVQNARTQGPQIVTLRGERAVVVVSARDYDALTAARVTIVDHLLSGSPWDEALAESVAQCAKTPSRDPAF